MEFLQPVLEKLREFGPMDVGDEQAFVLDDAVVIIRMDEGREMKIQVSVGPIRLEGVKTGLLVEDDGDDDRHDA